MPSPGRWCVAIFMSFALLLGASHVASSQDPSPYATKDQIESLMQETGNIRSDYAAMDKEIDDLTSRLQSIETTSREQTGDIGDTKTLTYVLIGTQLALVIGFLTLAAWIEHKAKAAVRLIESRVSAVKQDVDSHIETKLNKFKDEVEDLSSTILATKGSHDLIMCGKVLYWTNKYKDAIEPLSQALEIKPDDLEAKKFRGLCLKHLGIGNVEQAIMDMEDALASDEYKNDADLHLALVQSCIFARQWDKALKHAAHAEVLGHTSKEQVAMAKADAYKGQREFEKAIEVYDNIILNNPKATPAVLQKAEILYGSGEFDDLISLLQEAIKQRKNVSKYHIRLAVAYAERSNDAEGWKAALAQFNEAEVASKTDWDLWFYKGRAFLKKYMLPAEEGGQQKELLEEAKTCFVNGERLSKKSGAPRFINQLSRLHLLAGDTQGAIEHAKRSIASNPNYVQNHLCLCTALLAAKRWPDVIEALDEGVCQASNSPGKIWCSYFRILTNTLQRHDIVRLQNDIDEIAYLVEETPYFDPSGWDWSTTQEVVSPEISRLDEDVQQMVADLDRLLLNPNHAKAFKSKWCNS